MIEGINNVMEDVRKIRRELKPIIRYLNHIGDTQGVAFIQAASSELRYYEFYIETQRRNSDETN